MNTPIRRPLARKLLPWALLCVPLVFAARAATDYNAVPGQSPSAAQDKAARFADAPTDSVPHRAVSPRTLLRLTTSLGALPNQDGAERRLLHAYAQVAAGQLDAARAQAEQLVRDYPHFSLAQLLLGDVMQASAGSTAGFAAAPPAPSTEIEALQRARLLELRAEALARLGAYTAPPPSGAIPANLVALAPDVQRAIVVDTARSRLYLFEQRNGVPRLETSYYFSQGKLGAGKTLAGDMKTPLGIYFITRKIGAKDLKPLYGAGALTLNYPNEWDKQQGHTGFGVWLHGTPPDSYARVPLASDGCVVLSNPDVRSLMADTPAGSTPVVITRQVQWLSTDQWAAQRQRITAQLRNDITRAALQGLRPQEAPSAATSAPHGPVRNTPITPGALTVLQYPGQIVVQYSASGAPASPLYRQYWAQRSAKWQLIFQGSVS
ncbi:L,D-transpeptidase family protein [Thiomonas intermedia]|uniref:L,D-transpeptidase family protein n=1 Tax=Thiomonas intermedia TaxID=926 RepID=UPI001FE80BE6|nr:L,D-transpeptidase [Thiomonas intermedia]